MRDGGLCSYHVKVQVFFYITQPKLDTHNNNVKKYKLKYYLIIK